MIQTAQHDHPCPFGDRRVGSGLGVLNRSALDPKHAVTLGWRRVYL